MQSDIDEVLHNFEDGQKRAKIAIGVWVVAIGLISVALLYAVAEYTNMQDDVKKLKNELNNLKATTELELASFKELARENRKIVNTMTNEIRDIRNSTESLSLANNDSQKARYVIDKYLMSTPLTAEEQSIKENAEKLENGVADASPEVRLLRGINNLREYKKTKSAEKFQEAINNIDTAITKPSTKYIAHWTRGRAYFLAGRFAEALSEYQQVLESTDKKIAAAVLVDTGITKIRLHSEQNPMLESALADYNTAVEQGVNTPALFRRKGLIELRLNNIRNAQIDFDRAVSLSATSEELASSIENQALLSIRQNNWERSIAYSNQVLSVYPKSEWNWAIRTIAATKVGYDTIKQCSLERWIENGGSEQSSLRYYLTQEHWLYLVSLYKQQLAGTSNTCMAAQQA